MFVYYFRFDEMGIPFTVIVDDSTIQTGTIKIRNRDTRIKVIPNMSSQVSENSTGHSFENSRPMDSGNRSYNSGNGNRFCL